MKKLQDITVCVWDYGTFLSMAEMFAKHCAKVYYYSPFEQEYRDIKRCAIGLGLEGVERLNNPLDPEYLDAIDLHCFPDIGFHGQQKLIRSMGKAVWGSMGADNLELSRTDFLDMLKRIGLPIVKSEKILGLTNLKLFLKDKKDKWVKINRFRENMETWKHIDIEHSARKLEAMAVDFGGFQDDVEFVVQDQLESDVEIGYDGWSIDGKFPSSSFQGYERKNELYLGSLLKYKDLPDEILEVNERLSKVLKEYGYRNFIATEIRVKNKVPYFIDPTMRMPGQTGEHLFTTCTNIAECIWQGANGIMIEPKFKAKFVLEATMHYSGDCDAWKTMRVPKEMEPYVMLYHYSKRDGIYHFPTRKIDELGVLCGMGNTIEAAYENLMKHKEILKEEPMHIECEEFAHLIEEAHNAEKQGMEFSDQPLPKPEIALL